MKIIILNRGIILQIYSSLPYTLWLYQMRLILLSYFLGQMKKFLLHYKNQNYRNAIIYFIASIGDVKFSDIQDIN